MTAFLGEENVSFITLKELTDNRFRISQLHGRLANFGGDIDEHEVMNPGVFKMLIGGDAVDADQKFKDSIRFRPFAKLAFACNKLPKAPDHSGAWHDRWLIVSFCRGYDTPDPNLVDKLTQPGELSGLFKLAVAGLRRLEERGGFSVPPSVQRNLEDYRLSTDSVASFLRSECIRAENARIGAKALYSAYRHYCDEHGYSPVSAREFKFRLESLGIVHKHLNTGNAYLGVNLLKVEPAHWAG